MKPSDMKTGMLLLGPAGQVRKIVAINATRTRAQYSQISRGKVKSSNALRVGTLRWVQIRSIAEWAEGEVTTENISLAA